MFDSVFNNWRDRGYLVLPGHPDRKHPIVSGWSQWHNPDRPDPIPSLDEWKTSWGWGWAFERYENLNPFLLPASHPTRPLTVVDVDDLEWLPHALEKYGDTPMKVWTRRGVHLYYRGAAKSRNSIMGGRTYDVKSVGGGVVAPRPVKDPKTDNYWCLYLLRDGSLDDLPEFPVDAYESAWHAHRKKSLPKEIEEDTKNPHYLRVLKNPKLTQNGTLYYCGKVSGAVEVVEELTNDRIPLEWARGKVYAFDRTDTHASGQVWRTKKGEAYYTDHSRGKLWKVIPMDKVEAFRLTIPSLSSSLTDRPQPSAHVQLPTTSRYLGNDINSFDGVTLLRAPHGTGKTYWSAQRIKAHSTAITIANTTALTLHNAARFHLPSYQDIRRGDAISRASTTVSSLHKIKAPSDLGVLHVDEADQVLAYLHSGRVEAPVRTLHKILDLLARAKEGLVTSADLDDETIDFFVAAMQKRGRAVRVVERKPESPPSRTIRVIPNQACEKYFDGALRKKPPGSPPVALGIPEKKIVGDLAWGYSGAGYVCQWISGENSQEEDIVRRLENQTLVAPDLDLFAFSPAIQSGVSVESPVHKVFIMMRNTRLPVESLAQMLMRFRCVEETEVLWGVYNWSARDGDDSVDCSDAALIDQCLMAQTKTDSILRGVLPRYVNATPIDEEFATTWRMAKRRMLKTLANPLKRIKGVCEGHGWAVEFAGVQAP